MTTSTGTGRTEGRHQGRETIARQHAERAANLGQEIRFFRSLGEDDGRIAARLRVAVENLDRYASQPEPDDDDGPVLDDGGYSARWVAGEGDRRAARAMSAAADLIRCVAAEDAEGVRLLLHKVRDWHALAVVLAAAKDGELG
jgi:hypothetical protein